LIFAIASSSVEKVSTGSTGPKISSLHDRHVVAHADEQRRRSLRARPAAARCRG
jgi:hypothetical protein